jgi:hypothetical protein
MTDILNKTIVLVLNRDWQAIHVRTPQEAFCMMVTNVATALEIDGSLIRRTASCNFNRRPCAETSWAVLVRHLACRVQIAFCGGIGTGSHPCNA